jgi:hypothetical protein
VASLHRLHVTKIAALKVRIIAQTDFKNAFKELVAAHLVMTYIAIPQKVHGVALLNTLFVARARNVFRVHVLVEDVIRILVSLWVVEIPVIVVARTISLLFVQARLHVLAVVF